ncbi:MAG: hypothetical protein JNM90_16280 [Burkholderiales bacterium]|nr:hypothetical protein [Burkholderiales bacterium]
MTTLRHPAPRARLLRDLAQAVALAVVAGLGTAVAAGLVVMLLAAGGA